ncbi:MAG: universal stress protein [Anaerolineae bacterium]|jgi:nucleotide-binding universal stress UspA family protein|nr:universal stress protein [Anaerolineae bacterium]MBT3713916.1 universal stress protein [Anaerolineae bacterium]MBT4310658.1 universal stress protein [Anaerolineae bacterium]MBT4459535.1 universal stress protein [Anaerolineae bacterium]MBT4841086.1 universal stress protein [Anaerolineae bacterium]
MKNKILLVTNGCRNSWATVQYAAGMAETMKMPLTLLGVVEKFDAEHPVEETFSRAVTLFQEKNLVYNLQIVNGDTEDVLAELDWDENTYLFVGPLGRSQFRHWLVGRSLRKILENVPSPIFYTREARLPIKKILICFGGLEYTGRAEEIGLEIGKRAGAEVKFLHVIPPVESDHLPMQEIKEDSEESLDENPARTLKNAQKHAKKQGIKPNVIVRQGNIVQQILAELDAQRYDLICMGSSFSDPNNLRRLYVPNVTAEIAEAVNCPVLTARSLPAN